MASGNQPDPRRPVFHRKPTPPPPIVAYEDVKAACGHIEKFGLFEDRKDRFRRDRRKKITDRPCRACREIKRQEEERLNLAKKAEKQQRLEQEAQAREQKKMSKQDQGRLPDGAKVAADYDGAKQKWTGTLTIGDKVFTDSAGGLFTLLRKLDEQYRDSLPAEA